jgi:hypothetical protein
MQLKEISLSDIITFIGIIAGLLTGGALLIKMTSKNKNVIKGNKVKGNIIGGSRRKDKDNKISKKIKTSNKNTIKNNTVGGDLIGGDDIS